MRKVLTGTVIVCMSVLFSVALFPLSAQDVRPAAAPNSAISIPASAFQERNDGYDFVKNYRVYLVAGSDAWYFAPVDLPHGATIRKIRLICQDNNAGDDISLILYRQNLAGDIYQIGTVSSSGSNSSVRIFNSAAISPRNVNNFKNSYYLMIHLPGTGANGYYLYQVKILFDAP